MVKFVCRLRCKHTKTMVYLNSESLFCMYFSVVVFPCEIVTVIVSTNVSFNSPNHSTTQAIAWCHFASSIICVGSLSLVFFLCFSFLFSVSVICIFLFHAALFLFHSIALFVCCAICIERFALTLVSWCHNIPIFPQFQCNRSINAH